MAKKRLVLGRDFDFWGAMAPDGTLHTLGETFSKKMANELIGLLDYVDSKSKPVRIKMVAVKP